MELCFSAFHGTGLVLENQIFRFVKVTNFVTETSKYTEKKHFSSSTSSNCKIDISNSLIIYYQCLVIEWAIENSNGGLGKGMVNEPCFCTNDDTSHQLIIKFK